GTVEAIDADADTMTIRTDRGTLAPLTARYLEAGHVRHAYALTGHAGQGATVERTFVLGHDRGRLQEWGDVALSRARDGTRIYVAEPFEAPERVETGRDISALERMTNSFETSARETLATLTASRSTSGNDRTPWRQQAPPTDPARDELRAI